MKFVVSRDPCLSVQYLLPSPTRKDLPNPVQGRTTFYHFWARNALFHALGILDLKVGDKVLVPAFHCRTVVEPIIQFGCEVVFYNVYRDGFIDFEDVEEKIDHQTKAILAIHYFGVLQPVHRLQTFCRKHKLLFIEDCAHILIGDIDGKPIGSFGDVSIFSWRKFFPLYDGGLLVQNHDSSSLYVNWEKLDIWFEMKIIKNLLEKAFKDLGKKLRNGPALYTDRLPVTPEVLLPNEGQANEKSVLPTQAADFDCAQVNWPMSRWSKAILTHIDIPSVVEKRKANSSLLLNALKSFAGVQPWSTVAEQAVCGWGFPIVSATRQNIHVKLRERGIEAFTWGGVIHPTLPLEKFPDAKFLYEHLILLPNQQSLTQHEINLVIHGVKDVLQNTEQAVS